MELIGMKFFRLTVTGYSHKKQNHHYYKCICECGKVKSIRKDSLINGDSKSCGCLAQELASERHKKHGLKSHPLYNTWKKIISRCQDDRCKQYYRYGGRGINVCERWLKIENFINDMYHSWQTHTHIYGKNNTSIDRIDNNSGYCLENCRWATNSQQSRNTRRNIIINGVCLLDYCRKHDINYECVSQRIRTLKWDVKKAVETPTRLKFKGA